MTISTTEVRKETAGNGVTTAFPFVTGAKVLQDADLLVYVVVDATGVQTLQVLNTDYTVAGAGTTSVTVNMSVAPASGETLVVINDPASTQETDYTANDPFPADSHENALDLLTILIQRLQDRQDRSLQIPEGDPDSLTLSLPSAVDRASSILAFDASGNLTTVASSSGLAGDGTVAVPAFNFAADTDTGFYRIASGTVGFSGNGVLRAQLDVGGVKVIAGTAGAPSLAFIADADSGLYSIGANNVGLALGGSLVFDFAAGRLAGPAGSAAAPALTFTGDPDTGIFSATTNALGFATAGAEVMRLNASGELTVGANAGSGLISARNDAGDAIISALTSTTGSSIFRMGDTTDFTRAQIEYDHADDNMIFKSAGAERMRLESGALVIGKSASGLVATAGIDLFANGEIRVTRDSNRALLLNRTTNDGTLVAFLQDGTQEGDIAVSGTTISYNAFAGSHNTQFKGGTKKKVLRGTVLDTIDELVDQKSERLPKVEVSKVAGSTRVYGVFMDYRNKDEARMKGEFLATALGAFVVRMEKGAKVKGGDLVESAGNGCARVQKDDVIRSSTIGKISSPEKTMEHADGTFNVPCVLMCG